MALAYNLEWTNYSAAGTFGSVQFQAKKKKATEKKSS